MSDFLPTGSWYHGCALLIFSVLSFKHFWYTNNKIKKSESLMLMTNIHDGWWSLDDDHLEKNTDDVEDDDHDDNWMFLQDVKHLLNRPSNLQSQMNSSRTSKAKLETTFKDATLSTLYWLVPFDRGWYNHPLYRRKDIFLVHHIFIQHKKVGVYQGKLSPNNYLLEIQMLNMSP